MIFRILIILFSLLGISATFMPWVHFPQVDGVFYGYIADGILTGFVFFIIFIYGIFTFRIKNFKLVGSSLIALLSFSMFLLSWSKINSVRVGQSIINIEDPRIARVISGAHEGIGVYIFGIAGICIFITLLVALIQQKYGKVKPIGRERSRLSKSRNLVISLLVIIALISSLFILLRDDPGSPDKESLKTIIAQDISNMGEALVKKDYEAFLEFNEPSMVEILGGKEKAIQLLQTSLSDLKAANTYLLRIELSEIHDTKVFGKRIQSVITQKVFMVQNGINQEQIQKMLAISDDRGASWHYMNIDGKTEEEIRAFFPYLMENIEF